MGLHIGYKYKCQQNLVVLGMTAVLLDARDTNCGEKQNHQQQHCQCDCRGASRNPRHDGGNCGSEADGDTIASASILSCPNCTGQPYYTWDHRYEKEPRPGVSVFYQPSDCRNAGESYNHRSTSNPQKQIQAISKPHPMPLTIFRSIHFHQRPPIKPTLSTTERHQLVNAGIEMSGSVCL